VLVPFICEALINLLSAFFPSANSFLIVYLIYDSAAIMSLLLLLYFWVRIWFRSEQALVGVLFFAGIMPMALQYQYFHPWSYLEVALFSAALIAMRSERYICLIGIVAVAAFNRETALFIPLTFLMWHTDFRDSIGWKIALNARAGFQFAVLLLVWAGIYFGLHYIRGVAPHALSMRELLDINTSPKNLMLSILNGGLFLGVFSLLALLGYKYAPLQIKRLATMIPFYVGMILLWGIWLEMRMFMLIFPVLVPLALSFIFHDESTMTPPE